VFAGLFGGVVINATWDVIQPTASDDAAPHYNGFTTLTPMNLQSLLGQFTTPISVPLVTDAGSPCSGFH
jgi:hypothetical protein